MKKQTIKIDFYGVSAENALRVVRLVVQGGKISKGNNIDHYCWATKFNTGEWVQTRQKRNKRAVDSFIVYKETKKS